MKRKLADPSTLFILIGGFFGLLFCVFTPYGTGFDEYQHLMRIYDISRFNLVPNTAADNTTVSFYQFQYLSYKRFPYQNQAAQLFDKQYFLTRPDFKTMVYEPTLSIYPPVMFLPQALVAGMSWRSPRLPVIPIVIVLRIVGLALYLLGCSLAIKYTPIGKWAFFILALTPTAIYQASTINADGYANASSFLFIAYVLYLKFQQGKSFSKKQVLFLSTLIFLVSAGKPGSIIILPILFLLPARSYSSKKQILAVSLTAIISVAFHISWMLIMSSKTQIVGGTAGTGTGQVMSTLLANALPFTRYFLGGLKTSMGTILSSWIAAYGFWVGKVPVIVYWIYGISLVLALVFEKNTAKLSRWNRLFLLGLFLMSVLVVFLLYTIPNYFSNSDLAMEFKQGRYLIALFPLLALPLTGLIQKKIRWKKAPLAMMIIGPLCYLSFYFFGLYATYYTMCGSYMFSGTDCQLPAYQNLDTTNPLYINIQDGVTIQQQFTNTCKDMHKISVNLDYQPVSNGIIQVSLQDSSGKVIASSTNEALALNSSHLLVLELSPNGLSQGDYQLVLTSSGVTQPIGVELRQPDLYPGELLVDNKEVAGDIVFKYFCSKSSLFSFAK